VTYKAVCAAGSHDCSLRCCQQGREQRRGREGEEGEGCLDDAASAASPAEFDQLLRLAEVEHILGAACLRLGFAAAAAAAAAGRATPEATAQDAGDGSSPPLSKLTATAGAVVVPSRPPVEELAVASAGGRRPWGFGTGPLAEVSATRKDVFFEEDRRRPVGEGLGEEEIIAQLEVRRMGARPVLPESAYRGGIGPEEAAPAVGVQHEHLCRHSETTRWSRVDVSPLDPLSAAIFCSCFADQDDGAPWSSVAQVVAAVSTATATRRSNNQVEDTGSGEEDRNQSKRGSDNKDEFAVFLSKAMLHLTRAASRSRWGRSWVKVRTGHSGEEGRGGTRGMQR